MNKFHGSLPWFVGAFTCASVLAWLALPPTRQFSLRIPGTDRPVGETSVRDRKSNPVLQGRLVTGNAKPADMPGSWAGFRGPDRTATSSENTRLLRQWAESGPRKLWSVDVGEGYAGAAVWQGRVFVMDYDRERKEEALRCLSLADGRENQPMSLARPLASHLRSPAAPAIPDYFFDLLRMFRLRDDRFPGCAARIDVLAAAPARQESWHKRARQQTMLESRGVYS
jgi:hypothetical protein